MLVPILIAVAAATFYLSRTSLDYVLDKLRLSRWNSSNAAASDFIRVVLLIIFAVSMATVQVWLGAVALLLYLAGQNRS